MIRQRRQLLHHRRHRARGHAVMAGLASAQIRIELILAPGDRRQRQRGQRRRFPSFGKAAGEIGAGLLCAQRVPRRMAGAAMAKTFDEIGAAIPDFRFACVGLERLGLMEQRVPSRQQRAKVERKPQRVVRRFRARWRLRHQPGIERLQVGIANLGEMGVGKRWVEMPTIAMYTFAHRALEGGIGPIADAGRLVGRDVG